MARPLRFVPPLVTAVAVLLLAGAPAVAAATAISPMSGSASGGTVVTIAPGSAGFQRVFGGSNGAFAIDGDGHAYAWGADNWGQLGDGGTTDQSAPVRVAAGAIPAGVTITQLAGGWDASYALGSDGHVYAWARNIDGQLGNGNKTDQPAPVRVQDGAIPAAVTITAIAAGESAGYALGSDGHVYAWGSNADGRLGIPTATTESLAPVAVQAGAIPTGVTITAIAAGQGRAYALGSDGNVYAWGSGTLGSLGDPTAPDPSPAPVRVAIPGGVTVTAVAAGQIGGYALGSDGHVYSWGLNNLGQLGDGTGVFSRSTPVQVVTGAVPAGVTLTGVAAGSGSGYAIGSDGRAYAWGYNANGQLGDGGASGSQSVAPVQVAAGAVPAGVTIVRLAAAYHSGSALGSDGAVYGFGDNGNGDLGDGTTAGRSIPVLGPAVTLSTASFGGVAATALTANGSGGTATSPAHAAGTVDVVLGGTITAGSTATTLTATRTLAGAFTYTADPQLAASGVGVPWGALLGAIAVVALGTILAAATRRRADRTG